ncbi:MAG TPA: NAD(P)H-binding protein, partial [Actinomycetota bacterium]|nr:NAD(P)H-binding protein [Actinomycetota bacterium]
MSNHGGARDGPLTVVTGGTGVLGREAVPQLIAGGHRVRVLSRRPAPVTLENVEVATGDIATGEGLDAALAGSDMILHLASSPTKSKTVDVEGTSRLIAAAQRCGAPHLVYVSIVGVDRIPWPYYRSKLAAEESVAAS